MDDQEKWGKHQFVTIYNVHTLYDPTIHYECAFLSFEEAAKYQAILARVSKEAVISVVHLYNKADNAPKHPEKNTINFVPYGI